MRADFREVDEDSNLSGKSNGGFRNGGSCNNRFVLQPDVAIATEVSNSSRSSLAITDFFAKRTQLAKATKRGGGMGEVGGEAVKRKNKRGKEKGDEGERGKTGEENAPLHPSISPTSTPFIHPCFLSMKGDGVKKGGNGRKRRGRVAKKKGKARGKREPQQLQMVPSGFELETLWLLTNALTNRAMRPVVGLFKCCGRALCSPFIAHALPPSKVLSMVSLPEWSKGWT